MSFSLQPRIKISRAHHGIGDAWFCTGVARVWHDDQRGLWPMSRQIDRIAHGRAGVIAAVDDCARNGVQLMGLREQPAVLGEKAFVLEIVVLNPGKG